MIKPSFPLARRLGIGDAQDGFFFRIKADGDGDNFMLVHRRSSVTVFKEVIVPRSTFNGDKLMVRGSGATLDLEKTACISWNGAGTAPLPHGSMHLS